MGSCSMRLMPLISFLTLRKRRGFCLASAMFLYSRDMDSSNICVCSGRLRCRSAGSNTNYQ
jgi:hypothetical protein